MDSKTEKTTLPEYTSTLDTLEIGRTATIISVEGDGTTSRRLLEMGVVPGATVRIVKTALFGCPMEVRIGNSYLVIRKSVAHVIVVKYC